MTTAKNIRDYLHLYLGCEGLTSDGRKIKLTVGNLGFAINPNYGDFKPILRPLSDMTKEEIVFKNNIFTNTMDLSISRREVAESFRYMLSKGLDIFGLIELGLAIDKTKIK